MSSQLPAGRSSSKIRANAIRALTMDAIQRANSGHPGAPMGMADIAEVLWTTILRHNPANPEWRNRDRFVLSNGHGSMLLYSLLHLTGYDLSIQELENFRQLGSKTPGHPEYGYTPGVETTTGPLGQGLANAVGMAIAEKILAARFNQTDEEGKLHAIVDHHTYVFAGDGCLMEGISHEVSSLAGTLGLGKLICIYDDNGISIDGKVSGWFTDDTARRFEAYGWHVIDDVDGHDAKAVDSAIRSAKDARDKPSIICCKTQIGYGSPNKAGTAASHGSPLGEDEIAETRKALGWESDPFKIPDEIYEDWNCGARGAESENIWQQQFKEYSGQFPQLALEFERQMRGDLPTDFSDQMQALLLKTDEAGKSIASRSASAEVIRELANLLPELIGGSADLSGSNLTHWPEAAAVTAQATEGNYIYYGVREFGMTAICNGISLHGGLIPFSGTFLIFMEYARNAVRMSALMGIRNILVYTHDSIAQGEDGPTHQPVEQLTNLRSTPNMSVWRPCDAVETVAAWKAAIERRSGPTALVFSRQGIPHQERDGRLADIERGAYILYEPNDEPKAIIMATGSEVDIAMQAAQNLSRAGKAVRVVSMPSVDVFESQEEDYRLKVLPDVVRARVAVEAGHVDYWRKWVGLDGEVVGLSTFGESGPGAAVMGHFGITPEAVVAAVNRLL
ncbi:MAG: transketolase [Gammaproteobacteria bacterium]|jgi:transketolase|nr:transketolase [Gammaproteobacteria bacterium]|tara:strand:+ start:3519 stop:5549 length:2031 start_codon:yes stop_codon:yes gene_type:complete